MLRDQNGLTEKELERPVSSRSSRAAAWPTVSPGRTKPPGRAQLPRQGWSPWGRDHFRRRR